MNSYCGFVAILGRPNVGKSTLLNKLLGQKVSITSRKAQTTRHQILGIHTKDNYQTIYIDTPGIHGNQKKALNRIMNKNAVSASIDVDLIVFMVEGTKWTEDDQLVLDKLKSSKAPVILAINKVDNIADKSCLLEHIQKLSEQFKFSEVLPLSAQNGLNVDKLQEIIHKSLKPGQHHFPSDYVTDRSARFLASEIIREKLFRFTGAELPYSVTVSIEQFQEVSPTLTKINAVILIDRKGQKKIIVGKDGAKIKQIGIESRQDLEKMLDTKVYLDLWVKVKENWADDEIALHSLGYVDVK